MITVTIQNVERVLTHIEAMEKRIGPRLIQITQETAKEVARNMRTELTKRKTWVRFGGSELRRSIRAVTKRKSKKENVAWVVSYHPRGGAIPADRGGKAHFEVNPWGHTWRPKTKRGNAWLHPGSRPLNYIQPSVENAIKNMRAKAKKVFSVENLMR